MAFCYKQKPQNYCAMDPVNKSHGLRTDLEETVNQMEKRHGELTNRRRYLAEKIMTLEKAMPLLVANKFWKCGQRDNTPCKKIQEFVDQLSPYPYPNFTDKLLKETNGKSQRLDEETKQLHKLGKSQNHPTFGVYSSSARDDMCHCGSDESFFQDNPSSEDDSNSSDGGNSEEYWECCDCQASSEPNTQNSGCAASVMSRKK